MLEGSRAQRTLQEVWDQVMVRLRLQVSGPTFDTWAEDIVPLSFEQGVFRVGVPHEFVKDLLEERYATLIRSVVSDIVEENIDIEFRVIEGAPNLEVETELSLSHNSEQPRTIVRDRDLFAPTPLNAKYTFDNFVVGPSNQLGHAAATAVARAPAKRYNPLFIYGGVGLGKTHLMQAIGHRVLEVNPSAEVFYVSGETFLYHVVSAIREDRTAEFRRRYRSVDLWLVDDIQFIASRESTRTEADFFHTFNALYDTNRQIVISSDRPPKDLQLMDDRLRSRFEWGLIVDIKPPDRETRIAILQKKAESEGVYVPDDAILYIANMIQSNIRILEGALIKVIAYASLTGSEITLPLAKESLRDYSTGERPLDITVEMVQNAVASYFEVDLPDLIGKGRSREVVIARHVAMYLCRELTGSSYPEIGSRFGGRDHSTVISACEKIADLIKQRDPVVHSINEITERLELA